MKLINGIMKSNLEASPHILDFRYYTEYHESSLLLILEIIFPSFNFIKLLMYLLGQQKFMLPRKRTK